MKQNEQSKSVKIPLRLHALIEAIGAERGMFKYGVIDAAVKQYAKKFCPELVKSIAKRYNRCAR